ncbi:TetR/AcrR family transcriptional regulator [Brachybacterium sp. AOP25-B2-12]|uniref:TetR/AcrR family transcriptional regulator n=1 Tax=Brachybacterium sp. AOP25-B2-12 TaxID=3457710 RepID=UPI004033DD29
MTSTGGARGLGGERPALRPYDDTLRRDLALAAARALSEGGPAGLSIRSLAREAGTSTQAVYSLFGGKTGLVDAVIAEGFAQLAATLGAVVPDEDPVTAIFELTLAYRAWASLHPALYTAMFATRGRGIDVGGLRAARDGSRVRPMADLVPQEVYAAMEATVSPVMEQAYRILARGGEHQRGSVAASERAHDLSRSVWCAVHGWVDLETSGFITRWPPFSQYDGDEAFRQYARALVASLAEQIC